MFVPFDEMMLVPFDEFKPFHLINLFCSIKESTVVNLTIQLI